MKNKYVIAANVASVIVEDMISQVDIDNETTIYAAAYGDLKKAFVGVKCHSKNDFFKLTFFLSSKDILFEKYDYMSFLMKVDINNGVFQ